MTHTFANIQSAWLTEFHKQKHWVEHAFSQVPDEKIHDRCLPGVNPPSIILKHLAGSLKSRFTDFLTTDGEKDWRDRDGEFALGNESRAALMRVWEDGWSVAIGAVEALTEQDMAATITIRTEPMLVPVAITRAIGHCAYHTGQMMLICRTLTGEQHWKWATVAPGQSQAFKTAMREKFS